MSLVSRRNAAAGWLAWTLGKRMLRKKAKAVVPGKHEHAKKPKALVAVLIAAGAGVATFLRLRSGEDET